MPVKSLGEQAGSCTSMSTGKSRGSRPVTQGELGSCPIERREVSQSLCGAWKETLEGKKVRPREPKGA